MVHHNIFNKIIELEVLLLVFLVPLLFSSQTSNPVFIKHVVAGFLVFSLFLVGLLRFYEDRDLGFLKIKASLPLLLFLILALASLFYSSFFYASMWGFLRLLSLAVLFYLVVSTFRTKEQHDKVFHVLALVLFITSVYALLQYFQLVDVGWTFDSPGARISSTFGNPNFFAGFVVLVLPLMLYLFFYKKGFWRHFGGITAFLSFVVLLFTKTRGAWLGFLVSLIFIALFYRKKLLRKKVLVPLAIVLVLFVILNPVDIRGRFLSIFSYEHHTNRIEQWQTAYSVFKEHPVVGNGIMTYGLLFPNHYSDYKIKSEYFKPFGFHVHNEFLEIAAELGIIGLFLFLWFLFAIYLEGFLRFKEKRYIFLLAGVSAVLVHNLFSIALRRTALLVIFWVVLGLIVSIKKEVKEHKTKKLYRNLLIVFAILLIFFGGFYSYQKYTSDVKFLEGKQLLDSDKAKAGIVLTEAMHLNPYNPQIYFYLMTAFKGTDKYLQTIKFLNNTYPNYLLAQYAYSKYFFDRGDYDIAMQEFEKIKNPYLRDYWKVQVYKKLGMMEYFYMIKNLSERLPGNAGLHLELMNIYNNLGEFEKAEKEFSKAVELNPKDTDDNEIIIRVYMPRGEWNKTLKHFPYVVVKSFKMRYYYGLALYHAGQSYFVPNMFSLSFRYIPDYNKLDKEGRNILKDLIYFFGDNFSDNAVFREDSKYYIKDFDIFNATEEQDEVFAEIVRYYKSNSDFDNRSYLLNKARELTSLQGEFLAHLTNWYFIQENFEKYSFYKYLYNEEQRIRKEQNLSDDVMLNIQLQSTSSPLNN